MNRQLNRAANLLLLLLGVYPQIALLVQTLHCSVDRTMLLWILLLCVFVWLAASYDRGILIGMPLSALALYAAYRFYDANPSVQLVDLFDRITAVYYQNVYAPGSSYAYASAVQSHALVLVFLAFLLAAYLASSLTSRVGRVPLTLLGVIPLSGACLSVNGSPSALTMLAFVLFLTLLVVSGNAYLEKSAAWRSFFAVLLPAALLLSILLLIYSPDRYRYDEEDIARSQRVDRLSADLSRWLGEKLTDTDEEHVQYLSVDPALITDAPSVVQPQTGWGEIGMDLDLSRVFDPSVLGKTVLYATADADGTVYLRMLSYGDYTGTAWRLAEEPAPESSLSFAAASITGQPGAQRHRLSVRTDQPLPYLACPYYLDQAENGDVSVPAAGLTGYELSYLTLGGDLSSLHVPTPARSAEEAYREYAHAYYTRLPDSTARELRTICADAGLLVGAPDLIQRVASFVQSTVAYDLFAAPFPSDDYAVYFLTQADSGYCIHFATAAAALYRTLGIPARVTVGYLLDAQRGAEIEVTEADAHAWVEVYQDGLGWLPVEVTGSGGAGALGEAAAEEPSAPSEEESAAPQPAEPEGEPSAPKSPGQTSLPVGVVTDEAQEAGESATSPRRSVWPTLLRILPAVLIVSALPLWHRAARVLLRRSYRQADRKKAVVAIYRSAVRVERFGAAMPAVIRNCAERAAFSQHEITEAERSDCEAALDTLLSALYQKLDLIGKLRLKYLCGLL
ncbi:MAG: transglutaminase domain-containing protein [Oscillospiraceae bacterium]|nr:transglutaminase domain-containing protein [Oscillospiraceae bacterium]